MQIFKRLSKVAIMLAAVVAFASCTEKQELNEDDLLEGMYKIDVQGVTFYMIEVEGGMFTMGAQGIDFDALEDEMPTHNVELSKYYIGETEVTQALWQAVMDTNPSRFNIGDVSQKPVENVSWNDCQLFVDRLNQLCEERLNQQTCVCCSHRSTMGVCRPWWRKKQNHTFQRFKLPERCGLVYRKLRHHQNSEDQRSQRAWNLRYVG